MENVSVTANRLIHGNDKTNIYSRFSNNSRFQNFLNVTGMYNFRRKKISLFCKTFKSEQFN